MKQLSTRLAFNDDHGENWDAMWYIFYKEPRWWNPVPMRHGKGTVASFTDAHSEFHPWKDERTIEYAQMTGPRPRASEPHRDPSPAMRTCDGRRPPCGAIWGMSSEKARNPKQARMTRTQNPKQLSSVPRQRFCHLSSALLSLFRISCFGFRISPLLLAFCCLLPGLTNAWAQPSLEEGFRLPPQSAGVRCFWWWLNGNVTKEAITRDLEEMKAKGFSGAMIFDAGGAEQRGNRQVPAGPMFTTPAWRELFVHAVREADRLGLELSLSIQSGWNLGGPMVTPEMAAKMLTWSEIQVQGPATFRDRLPQPRTKDEFYRDIAVLAYPVRSRDAESAPPIRDLAAKTASKEIGMSAPDSRFLLTDVPATPGEEDVRAADVLDISGRMTPEGELAWDVPAGNWTILRFGYTPSPARVSTSSAGWQGRVIDYMDSAILRQYWDAVVAPLLADVGPLAGKGLKYLHTDSWECGGANWTESFPQQFEQRRRYNPLPYLPVVAGKIVESRDASNRFLADFRKTLGDCIAENHYATFAQLAHERGMASSRFRRTARRAFRRAQVPGTQRYRH